jgi:porphyrinogen peroxidase
LFFVPPASFLDNITTDAPVAAQSAEASSTESLPPVPLPTPAAAPDTSLRIGSLKGEKDE